MIQVAIVDSSSGKPLKVNGEGEISVTLHNHPPLEEDNEAYPFAQWFTNQGSKDMRVDGSVTPVEFTIEASPHSDLWVKTITMQISDPGARLNEFGNLTALTNGIEFFYENSKLGKMIIDDEIKTNLDLMRLGSDGPGYGDGDKAMLADIGGGTGEDTYLPKIDLALTFGFPYGVHLKRNQVAKIGFTIKDDLSSGISVFNAKGKGIQI